MPQVALPIGISFYVFQIISYMVDVRQGTVEVQRNPFKFMLYVSLFPQLIAGPIVRYATIAQDIANRKADFENIVAGFRRFTIGLAKKVLVADVMAGAVDVIFAAKAETIPGFYRFLGAHRAEPVWCVDDDISKLLNIWYNPSLWNNPHYAPEFNTNVVANAGSVIVLGDCYREQIAKIFKDAKLFDPKKIVQSKRHGGQKAKDFQNVIGDLKLVVMTYQSFNTDRLDEREKEIVNVFSSMREARKKFAEGKRVR